MKEARHIKTDTEWSRLQNLMWSGSLEERGACQGLGEEDMGNDGPGYRISIVHDEYFLEI